MNELLGAITPGKLPAGARSVRQLLIQRLTILEAAAEEHWPLWDDRANAGFLRQEVPQSGMVPAKFMHGTVAVCTHCITKLDKLREQFLATQFVEIRIPRNLPLPHGA